jgi:hypothetical protein
LLAFIEQLFKMPVIAFEEHERIVFVPFPGQTLDDAVHCQQRHTGGHLCSRRQP